VKRIPEIDGQNPLKIHTKHQSAPTSASRHFSGAEPSPKFTISRPILAAKNLLDNARRDG
jgi:hypothetical protein